MGAPSSGANRNGDLPLTRRGPADISPPTFCPDLYKSNDCGSFLASAGVADGGVRAAVCRCANGEADSGREEDRGTGPGPRAPAARSGRPAAARPVAPSRTKVEVRLT
jgi:hypothetical protein